MLRKRFAIACVAACAGALSAQRAAAVDVNVGIGLDRDRRPPVVVQPAPVETRRWVPEHVVRKEERVLASPGTVERREESVLVEPARRVVKQERVLVRPERVEQRTETVVVRPGGVERVWIPPVTEQVRVGPVSVARTVKEGYFREVPTAPVTETRTKQFVVPAQYDVVSREVEVPARYETRMVEVPVAPRHSVVTRDVVVPGHWEETVVQPAPVIVEQPRRSGLEIDLDFNRRRRN